MSVTKKGDILFSSERYPLTAFGCSDIRQVRETAVIIDIPVQDEINEIDAANYAVERPSLVAPFVSNPVEEAMLYRDTPKLLRCSKCVLPHTMPFISFDSNGVCNYCNNWEIRNEIIVTGKQIGRAHV